MERGPGHMEGLSKKGVLSLFLFILCAFFSANAHAYDCGSPNADEPEIEYFNATHEYKFCNGTEWVTLSVLSVPPQVSLETLNPSDKNANVTLSNGNLTATIGDSTNGGVRALTALSSGKYYWEVSYGSSGFSPQLRVGIAESTYNLSASLGTAGVDSWGYNLNDGSVMNDSNQITMCSTGAPGDVAMVALDLDNDRAWFGLNGTWCSGDPSAGTSPTITGLSATYYVAIYSAGVGGGETATMVFSDSDFSYSRPSGFNVVNKQ